MEEVKINNLNSRIEKHNLGKGAKYTKTRLPVSLVYSEKAKDKSQSLKREIEIKKLSRTKKRKNTLFFIE